MEKILWITVDYTMYYNNGNINVTGSYKNGNKEGEWKEYYKSGKIKYIDNYLENLQNGISKRYFENGKVEFIVDFFDGYENGNCKTFYENGILRSKGGFNKGKKIDEWIYYKKTGEIERKSKH